MSDSEQRLRKFLTTNPARHDGETIAVVAKGMPLGGIKKFAKDRSTMMVGGVVGALIAHSRDKKIVADDLATSMRNGVYLVATDRRLLIVAAGGMRGMPQEHLGSVERTRIQSVERGETRVSLVKMTTAVFHLDDGSLLGFEFPKVDAKDADSLLRSFGA